MKAVLGAPAVFTGFTLRGLVIAESEYPQSGFSSRHCKVLPRYNQTWSWYHLGMKLEVCIDRVESALAAKEGGADRIEVCGALTVGGITPSYGLIEQCVALRDVEVMVMIAPVCG